MFAVSLKCEEMLWYYLGKKGRYGNFISQQQQAQVIVRQNDQTYILFLEKWQQYSKYQVTIN